MKTKKYLVIACCPIKRLGPCPMTMTPMAMTLIRVNIPVCQTMLCTFALMLAALLSLVSSLVADEAGFLAKALIAFLTCKGPLPGMDPLVLDEHGVLDEALVALVTFIGSLSRVSALVGDQV